jgi:predicted RNase H-like HicB family nuclease
MTQYAAAVEYDGEWYVASCPEIPGANGQGRAEQECVQSLRDAITLILEADDEFQGPGLKKYFEESPWPSF